MVASRELVRLPVMRGTLHLVTAADALSMPIDRPLGLTDDVTELVV